MRGSSSCRGTNNEAALLGVVAERAAWFPRQGFEIEINLNSAVEKMAWHHAMAAARGGG